MKVEIYESKGVALIFSEATQNDIELCKYLLRVLHQQTGHGAFSEALEKIAQQEGRHDNVVPFPVKNTLQ